MGLGNVDYGDDGFGVRLAEALANRAVRRSAARTSIVGVSHRRHDARALHRPRGGRGFDHLIFLDAVEFGGAPARWCLLDSDEMAARFPQISTHKISLGLLAKRVEANGTDESLAAGRAAGVAQAGRRADPDRAATLELLLDLLSDSREPR